MVAFAVLVVFRNRIQGIQVWEIVRTYRAWGPALGLSLGACIFGLLGGHWLQYGAFDWGWSTSAEQLDTVAWLAFLLMWASNIKLEIWTLEPLRKLDKDGQITDKAAFSEAAAGLSKHMMLHATLVVSVVILAHVSGNA